MKIESRIIKNGNRTISIKEAEAIYEEDRIASLEEFFGSKSLGDNLGFENADFLSMRGGVLG